MAFVVEENSQSPFKRRLDEDLEELCQLSDKQTGADEDVGNGAYRGRVLLLSLSLPRDKDEDIRAFPRVTSFSGDSNQILEAER